MRRKKHRCLSIFGMIIIGFGVISMGFPSLHEWLNQKRFHDEINAFMQELREECTIPSEKEIVDGSTSVKTLSNDDGVAGNRQSNDGKQKRNKNQVRKSKKETKETETIHPEQLMDEACATGIIEIPAIKLQYLIYEGTDDNLLSKGIGHLKGTAEPGQTGNCVLAGHTGSYDGVFFNRIPELKEGEQVVIRNRNLEKMVYRVVSSMIVLPSDPVISKKPVDAKEKRLTLLTCADHGEKRFICQCVLEDE